MFPEVCTHCRRVFGHSFIGIFSRSFRFRDCRCATFLRYLQRFSIGFRSNLIPSSPFFLLPLCLRYPFGLLQVLLIVLPLPCIFMSFIALYLINCKLFWNKQLLNVMLCNFYFYVSISITTGSNSTKLKKTVYFGRLMKCTKQCLSNG